jgi:multidrug resistance efflux pump
VQSQSDYDAAFIVQVESQITTLQQQQTSYSTQVATLNSQLDQPVIDPKADPAAAVTASFMLAACSNEQQIQTQQATIQLQEMSLQLTIDQANIKAPVAGTLDSQVNYEPGDQVSAGQALFQVVPSAWGTVIQAAVPASSIAALAVGETIPCAVPDDPSGNSVDIACAVTQISSGYYQTQDGQLYYDATFGIDPGADLEGYGDALPAGLPVNITIPVHESSGLRWLGEKVGLIKT